MQEAMRLALRTVVVCHALTAEPLALYAFTADVPGDLGEVGCRTLLEALPFVQQSSVSAGGADLCILASVAVSRANHAKASDGATA